MNEGIIAARYARALFKLTSETGRGEQVCEQVEEMLSDPPVIPAKPETDLASLVSLMKERGREQLLKRVLLIFRKMYYESINVKVARLTTVIPDSGLADKLRTMMEEKTGSKVVVKTITDPAIEGGFVFEIDGYEMDGSVRTQLEHIRRQFIEDNRRLV